MPRWAFGAIVVGMFIAAVAGTTRANEPVASTTLPGIDWSKCGERLECAQVRVPLDWDRPDGTKITLAVVRYLASRPRHRIGSLFVNFGGPGVAGAAAVKGAGALLDGLGGGRFDVVGWDPRGTGESTHVRCFASESGPARFWGQDWTIPTTQAESRRYVPKTIDYARRCEAQSGALLAHISTADTVRDLDYLRQLVGDSKLTYRGLSYGTFLGQTYANMFPHRVRAMILDGVIDATEYTKSVDAGIANNEANADLVFEKFLALCQAAGPKKCALAGKGPVKARVQTLLNRLRQGPIPARSAPPPRQLRYGDALVAFWTTLGDPSEWPNFAAALDEAADGDGSRLVTPIREGRAFFQSALVPAVALQCADKNLPRPGTVQTWPKVIDRLRDVTFVAPVDAWWLWAPCASWRTPSADRYTGPWNAATPNPILVIGNRYDSRTAFPNARRTARRLGNAVLLTLDGYGHTSDKDPSVCLDRAVRHYLISTTPPPDGTVCQPDRQPFDPNFGQPLP